MLTNWIVWPGIQIFNFMRVPLLYKVLYDNFATFWWNIILSYITFTKLK